MSSSLTRDFNAVISRNNDLIPEGTFVKVRLSIVPGGYGAGGLFKMTKTTNTHYLPTVLTVVEGAYVLRKIFHRFAVSSSEPHDRWVEKSLRQLRSILESAHGILPTDTSPEAREKRRIQDYTDFNGLMFLIKVGVEVPRNPRYRPTNYLSWVVTPDYPEYAREFSENTQKDWPF